MWKQCDFLASGGNNIENGQYVQKLLAAMYFLPLALGVSKIPGHSKLESLEAKENHLANTSARNGSNSSQISVMVQRETFPCDNLEKIE